MIRIIMIGQLERQGVQFTIIVMRSLSVFTSREIIIPSFPADASYETFLMNFVKSWFTPHHIILHRSGWPSLGRIAAKRWLSLLQCIATLTNDDLSHPPVRWICLALFYGIGFYAQWPISSQNWHVGPHWLSWKLLWPRWSGMSVCRTLSHARLTKAPLCVVPTFFGQPLWRDVAQISSSVGECYVGSSLWGVIWPSPSHRTVALNSLSHGATSWNKTQTQN